MWISLCICSRYHTDEDPHYAHLKAGVVRQVAACSFYYLSAYDNCTAVFWCLCNLTLSAKALFFGGCPSEYVVAKTSASTLGHPSPSSCFGDLPLAVFVCATLLMFCVVLWRFWLFNVRSISINFLGKIADLIRDFDLDCSKQTALTDHAKVFRQCVDR